MPISDKPRLLILSHVFPFPRAAGQQQRVYYTLKAASAAFHVTFGTVEGAHDAATIRRELAGLCDDVLLLPRADANIASRIWHRVAGAVYAAATGRKRSNYDLGHVQFSPARVRTLIGERSFDCVLYEYWHAVASTAVFREKSITTVLDMHDILWRSYQRQLVRQQVMPPAWKRWAVRRYRQAEESAWREFDALVAINREEENYAAARLPPEIRVFYAAMGTDLRLWPYGYAPASPSRLAYYGSLGTPNNQEDAMKCVTEIMPRIWRRFPATELWLVGNKPPEFIRRLPSQDARIHVTGYVENVQEVLQTMTAVLCPWSGIFGFRSRLIEVLALGVPVIASRDAVAGMELVEGQGLLLADDAAAMATAALRFLDSPDFARQQSLLGRQQVERHFGLDATYAPFVQELESWVRSRMPSR